MAALTQQELESQLWDAANSLRGPVDPADFKAYIFPILKLSDRLEDLRRAVLVRAEDSVEFLKELLKLAKDTLAADKAEAEGTLDEYESALPDPHVGALTQIFSEYAPDTAPEILTQIVERIDTIAGRVRGTGWQESQPADKEVRREIRKVLREYSLPLSGDLYNRAYEYVRENY